MILTEEKTYIINVTEVDTDAELGLNKKDIMIEYTNLELLHAVLASTMPYGRLSARYRGKRKAELQSRRQVHGGNHRRRPLADTPAGDSGRMVSARHRVPCAALL